MLKLIMQFKGFILFSKNKSAFYCQFYFGGKYQFRKLIFKKR